MEIKMNMTDFKVFTASTLSMGSTLLMQGQVLLNIAIGVLTIIYLILRIKNINKDKTNV